MDSNKVLQYAATGMVGFLAVNELYDIFSSKKKQVKFENKNQNDDNDEDVPPPPEKNYREKSSTFPMTVVPKRSHINFARRGNVHKIVLTGGPCAGKTTAITLIGDRLRERGFKVFCVPECATLVFSGGVTIDISKMTMQENIRFHRTFIQFIMNQEERFQELASLSDSPTIILCDRGVFDVKAYMDPKGWQALMDENGWNPVQLRDKRYDGIIHLVTAADGAEEYYNQENKARYESTIDMALAVDKRLRDSWYGHPSYFIIDNKVKSFDEKMNNAYQALASICGIKESMTPNQFDKYLLKNPENPNALHELPSDVSVELFTIEDTFLDSGFKNIESKIRKRGQKGAYFYQHYTTTYPRDIDVHKDHWQNDGAEIKKQIQPKDFLAFHVSRDQSRQTLKKIRRCFLWEGSFVFIDTFINLKEPISLLFVARGTDVESLKLPSTLEVVRNVKNEKEYSSYELAKISKQEEKSEQKNVIQSEKPAEE